MADVDDDDFGELYADVEAQAISAVDGVRCFSQPYIDSQQATNSTAIGDFAPKEPPPTTEHVSQLLVESDGSQRLKERTERVSELRDKVDKKKEEVEQENSSNGEEENESDSEDDFNILLNEDDGSPPEALCDRGFQTREYGEVSDTKEIDPVGNGRELAGNCFREKSSRVNGGDHSSLYKNGSSLHNASISSLEDNGYGFLRPWYRIILATNFDAFEHKPWRNPGADITDFFNFGFNEQSWQGYCQSLYELHQQMSMVRTSPVSEDGGLQQLYSRVIQVEDGNRERPSSMDVRRPRNQDSDVVIEITVQDGKEHSSDPDKERGTGKDEIVHEVSKSRCTSSDDREEAQTLGIMDADNVCEEKVQSPCISSTIKRHYPYRAVEEQNFSLNDTDKSSAEMNPCLMKLDLSLDDTINGCTSSPSAESKSERSLYDDLSDRRGTWKAQRRSSSNSLENQDQSVESDDSFSRHHESDNINLKASSSRYSKRDRSPIEEEWKHCYGSHHLHDKLKICNGGGGSGGGGDDAAYYNPREEHRQNRHQFRNGHHKKNKHMHDLAFSDEDFSYDGEAEYFRSFDDKRVANHWIRGDCPRDYQRKNHHRSLQADMDPYFRRELHKKDFISGRANPHLVDEIGRSWYHHEGKLLHEDLTPITLQYGRSTKRGKLNSWREYDDMQFDRREKMDSLLESSYADDLFFDRFGGPDPLDIDEMDYINCKRGQLSTRSGRERRISGRVNRYGESLPFNFQYSCSREDDDACRIWQKSLYADPDYTDRKHDIVREAHDTYDSRLIHRDARNNRYVFTKGPGDGYFHGSDDAYDSYPAVRYHDKGSCVEGSYNLQSDAFNWKEGDLLQIKPDEELHENGISFDSISRSKFDTGNPRFLHHRMSNNRQVMKHGPKIIRGSGKLHAINSKALSSGKHVSGLRCRDSVGLHTVVRERKSSGGICKARNAVCSDLRVTLQRRNQKQGRQASDKSCPKKVTIAEVSRNEQFRTMQDDSGSDLEEGQIPAENSSRKVMKKSPSSVADNGKLKKKHAQDQNSEDIKNKGGTYSESWILETIAKMEKRKERFKEPILQKKGPELYTVKSDVDKPVETDQQNHQRPSRRRRWGGS